jgi:hypothetical protein
LILLALVVIGPLLAFWQNAGSAAPESREAGRYVLRADVAQKGGDADEDDRWLHVDLGWKGEQQEARPWRKGETILCTRYAVNPRQGLVELTLRRRHTVWRRGEDVEAVEVWSVRGVYDTAHQTDALGWGEELKGTVNRVVRIGRTKTTTTFRFKALPAAADARAQALAQAAQDEDEPH